jgi:Leucine-rich repeat (LRR) protein
MRTILKKGVLIFSLIFCIQTNVKAQLVFIPDLQFRNWLLLNYTSCMFGNSLDTTCTGLLNVQIVSLDNKNISDLTGISAFSNLKFLSCVGNQLTSLPTLPPTLESLYCYNNQITSLPSFPSTLELLDCHNNLITSLPSLSDSLKYFYCQNNQITSLPTLPSKLVELNCDANQLTTLPSFPSTLIELNCRSNQINSLPLMPSSLTYLNCGVNQLVTLPNLPTSLAYLFCDSNQLSSFPTIPNLIQKISCGYNQFSTLPALPNSMYDLYCENNQLTSLPTLPTSLRFLNCAENQITGLPQLPTFLIFLYCYDNQITSIPTLPYTLTRLFCYNNQLTSLPVLNPTLELLKCQNNQLTALPSLPSGLKTLNCNGNQITSLPTIPASLNYLCCNDNPITCLPDIKNVTALYFTNTLVTCVPTYGIVATGRPKIDTIPICDLFNSYGCEVPWNMTGKSYLDLDTNCIITSNEKGIASQRINLYRNGIFDQQTYTDAQGKFRFDAYTYQTYKIEADTTFLPFTINCPSTGSYTHYINAIDTMLIDRNFALKCKGIDIAATNIYTLNPRPGSIRTVNIQAGDLSNLYAGNCASGVCGTVTITITGACNYFSSPSYALAPTSAVGNVLTYNIVDFGVLSYDSTFDFNLLVDTTATLGSQICITVNVYTKCSQELNYSNNQLTQCFTVVGSYDPNDKAVYPTTTLDISGNKWLNYTIRFQNTGTADAENILITDTLSSLLDKSTFTLLNYSHEPFVQLYNNGVLKFNFPNIHLPDSNTNEPASHGYVQYKIRAKDSLTVGSTIDNTANIYFDFNAPVITNTTSNTLINCSIPKTILNDTICRGETYILNGQEYYSSGVYQQNILTAFGCDSVVELRLTVNTINNTITQNAGTLQTTATATNYQWINCGTGTAIVGANTQTYNPTQSGSYSVVVDFGTCKDTSTCFYFSPVGINEINASNISIQPNPFNNELKITLDKSYNGVLEVYNTIGEIITSEKLQSRNVTLNTSNWNAGVYILKVATNAGVVVKKVIKR